MFVSLKEPPPHRGAVHLLHVVIVDVVLLGVDQLPAHVQFLQFAIQQIAEQGVEVLDVLSTLQKLNMVRPGQEEQTRWSCLSFGVNVFWLSPSVSFS